MRNEDNGSLATCMNNSYCQVRVLPEGTRAWGHRGGNLPRQPQNLKHCSSADWLGIAIFFSINCMAFSLSTARKMSTLSEVFTYEDTNPSAVCYQESECLASPCFLSFPYTTDLEQYSCAQCSWPLTHKAPVQEGLNAHNDISLFLKIAHSMQPLSPNLAWRRISSWVRDK